MVPTSRIEERPAREWPVGFGAARAAESRWDPGLAARCDALLDALGFHGISQVEVKRDPRDGRDHLIEVNVTSPGALRKADALLGTSYCADLVSHVLTNPTWKAPS